MKVKPLNKFTNKTGIQCFMLPNMSGYLGFYVPSVKQPSVDFMTASGSKFNVGAIPCTNSEDGRKFAVEQLNKHIEADGYIFAPLHSKITHSNPNAYYTVEGDVKVTNYFGDKFLHVVKGRAKVCAYNKETNERIHKCRMLRGTRIFLAHQDTDFDAVEENGVWTIRPERSVPLFDTSDTFINRCSNVRARLKPKYWTRLTNGSYIAKKKTKVKFFVGDKCVTEHYVSAGTTFHPEDNMEVIDGKLFFECTEGHVMFTTDYVKIDYLVQTNMNYQVAKANDKLQSRQEKIAKQKRKAEKTAKKLAKKAKKQEA